MSRKVVILPNQSLVDIAVQELGSAEGLMDILKANPSLTQADDLVPGTEIVIDSEPLNIEVANYFLVNNLKVVSSEPFTTLSSFQYVDSGYVDTGYFV